MEASQRILVTGTVLTPSPSSVPFIICHPSIPRVYFTRNSPRAQERKTITPRMDQKFTFQRASSEKYKGDPRFRPVYYV